MNAYEANHKRRFERLQRRLRTCEAPINRAESAVQNATKQILEEFKWLNRVPFPIPPDTENDPTSHERRNLVM